MGRGRQGTRETIDTRRPYFCSLKSFGSHFGCVIAPGLLHATFLTKLHVGAPEPEVIEKEIDNEHSPAVSAQR